MANPLTGDGRDARTADVGLQRTKGLASEA